ncbi:MAG TPA: aldo/keto reductase [Cyclobacteriaceae bacterium]|nr:aldo/keto reductase [Cyclobacteriaceae bacterium]
MKYRLLGKSGLLISEISFGCMSLHGDHEANIMILQSALDYGINFFDTADVYDNGENEIIVGKAFKNNRDKVIIATKVGNQLKASGHGFDWNPSRKHILESVDKSLARLQTDYIDLYQLHGGTMDDMIDETIEAFELLKQHGKIKHYGISSIRPNVIREYVSGSNIVSVMMQYSLLDRRPEESCLDLLQQNSIGVIVRGALAKGLLVDKEPTSFLDHSSDEVHKAQNVIKHLSTSERFISDIPIQYVLSNPSVSTVVVGIRTPEQLKASCHASNDSTLSASEINQLRTAIKQNCYDQHR